MANRYDDETMKFIETRKRVAHMRREEAKRKRNIMIAIIVATPLQLFNSMVIMRHHFKGEKADLFAFSWRRHL